MTYLSTQILGDTLVRYPYDPATGQVGLELLPAAMADEAVPRRKSLRGEAVIDVLPGGDAWPATVVESLVQFKLTGDPYPGAFAQGHTMRNSETHAAFRYESQEVYRPAGGKVIVTSLLRGDGCRVEHRLVWVEGEAAFTIRTSFQNGSSGPVSLEMLSSFSLAGITPFHVADAPGRLRIHRFRSGWSAEARHESRSLEELHLERSWSGAGAFSERFGQLGTMPVRKWFPFVAAEDTEARVLWGAQLCWAGSWQMEIFRQHDDLALSGGLADREFGHWVGKIEPGEILHAPPAWVSCVRGGLPELCDRLTAMQDAAVESHPAVEQDLPVVFNEWCTTWGDPSEEKVTAIADRLQGTGVRYLVIDAGWYKSDHSDWNSGHGDWIPNARLFPNGLAAAAGAIRKRGLIPGIWFEMETVGSRSTAFSMVDHLLKRDGIPITVRERRFWDLCDPVAVDYLTQRVIGLLESCGFGYLKVDYNETAGLGADHPDSQGEGLRRQVEGGYRFFEKLRQRLPDLVIENCSSGGHRLEPSMLGRTAMSSFSDAHELVEIPLIAANLHQLILPRQSQIWAVLHPTDSPQRLRYSLAATFLGRMCLSGGIDRISPGVWEIVRESIALYQKSAPVIKYGTSRKYGDVGGSWRHPRGWQALVRTSENQALVVLHTFAAAPQSVRLPLAGWTLDDAFGSAGVEVLSDETVLSPGGDFTGAVLLFRR